MFPQVGLVLDWIWSGSVCQTGLLRACVQGLTTGCSWVCKGLCSVAAWAEAGKLISLVTGSSLWRC